MENTKQNLKYFNSSIEPQIKAESWNRSQGAQEVFFIVNIKELFGVDLNYPGIKKAINRAFIVSKQFVPVDTGLTKRSYSLMQLDDYRIKAYFDPQKIIGAKRKGKIVDEYYVQYIAEHASRFNWLSIVIKHFYDQLYIEMKALSKKESEKAEQIIDFALAVIFFDLLENEYKKKKDEAKRLRDEYLEKKRLLQKQKEEKKRLLRLKNQAIKELKE